MWMIYASLFMISHNTKLGWNYLKISSEKFLKSSSIFFNTVDRYIWMLSKLLDKSLRTSDGFFPLIELFLNI